MQEVSQFSASSDASGRPLAGGRTYKLHLPPDIPACDFWSVLVYDHQTNLIIWNGQLWPSVHSRSGKVVYNPDNSLDIWFGPYAPAGKENNWIMTIRGQRWYMILRLYYAMESWLNETWKPGEIKET